MTFGLDEYRNGTRSWFAAHELLLEAGVVPEAGARGDDARAGRIAARCRHE